MLIGYTYVDMAGNVDSRKFALGYQIVIARKLCHGSQSYRNVLLFPLLRQSLLQQATKVYKEFCGWKKF